MAPNLTTGTSFKDPPKFAMGVRTPLTITTSFMRIPSLVNSLFYPSIFN
jgi:hypothetical protein